MIYTYEDKGNKELFENLKINCEKCFGLCCTALYFSASEGFPENKEAGKPCINLKSDFKCSIHQNLRKQGLKGCMSYDCFGAGQKTSQVTYGGKSWSENTETSNQMFNVFLVIRQIHEMLWYLTQAFTFEEARDIKNDIYKAIIETENLTNLSAEKLLDLDIESHRKCVNSLLKRSSELVKKKECFNKKDNSKNKKKLGKGFDFLGKDLRNTNLIGADLKGALLIAANLRDANLTGANLIGADLRDADVRGANLSKSLFLTQMQINTAKGDSKTKLPKYLDKPSYWEK